MTVDLVRDANGMCSSNGWKSFIEDNCISIHDFLLFRYEGNMSFAVSVFDTTGCEKKYDFTSLARRMAVDDSKHCLSFFFCLVKSYFKKKTFDFYVFACSAI